MSLISEIVAKTTTNSPPRHKVHKETAEEQKEKHSCYITLFFVFSVSFVVRPFLVPAAQARGWGEYY